MPKAASCWPMRCGTARRRFKPQVMIDLATLTGAIIVALGTEHAGLFANDDELAEQLAGRRQGDRRAAWRMPLGEAYDKMIDQPTPPT